MKTLGQIAFEGSRITFEKGTIEWFLVGDWKEQSPKLKEYWENAAQAVKAECEKQLEAYRKVNAPITGEPNDNPA